MLAPLCPIFRPLAFAVFCLLGQSVATYAQTRVELSVTHANGNPQLVAVIHKDSAPTEHKTFPLRQIHPHTHFHTWTSPESAKRWIGQNGPDDAEMQHLVQTGGGLKGGGLYTSLNGIDSIGFGTDLVVFENHSPFYLIAETGDETREKILDRLGYFGDARKTARYQITQELTKLQILGVNYEASSIAARDVLVLNHPLQWVNLWSQHQLGQFRSGTSDDVVRWLSRGETDFDTLEFLLSIEDKIQIQPSPHLESGFPTIHRLLTGQKVHLSEIEPLRLAFRPESPGVTNPLLGRIVKMLTKPSVIYSEFSQAYFSAFRSEVVKYLRHRLNLAIQSKLNSSQMIQEVLKQITSLQVYEALDALAPAQIPSWSSNKNLAPHELKSTWNLLREKHPFSAKLLLSLLYIDYPDFLVEVSTNHSEPWNRYGVSDFRRYESLNITFERKHIAHSSPVVEVQQLHQKITSDFQDFSQSGLNKTSPIRDFDILAGGDLYPDAQGGYYRITQLQLERLNSNPFLAVETKADPHSQSKNPTVLARHWYASIRNYKKFESFLSDPLKAKLKAAEEKGILGQPQSSEYKELTRNTIEALFQNALKMNANLEINLTRVYQQAISIHPFTDFNGRSLRAYFWLKYDAPIFLTDLNLDLFLNDLEFYMEYDAGKKRIRHIQDAIFRELEQNPGFPRLYDLPEWFEILGNHSVSIESQKAKFRDPNVAQLIRQKRFQEIPELCNQIWLGTQ